MRYFSMFSGIGGFEEGIRRVDEKAECVGFSEIDKYAIQIYQSHFKGHKNYGDATRIVPEELSDFDFLCYVLQFDIDHNHEKQIEATQVKEKFGGLRFYTTGTSDRQNGMIDFAEHISMTICEECGNPGKPNRTGWIKTLCNNCKGNCKEE